jgi:hypothetical protein
MKKKRTNSATMLAQLLGNKIHEQTTISVTKGNHDSSAESSYILGGGRGFALLLKAHGTYLLF